MTARVVMFAVLIVLVALTGGTTAAQAPSGQIEERVLLDNDSVRIVFVTYPPGADSDLHLSLGPEITLVQESWPSTRRAGARLSGPARLIGFPTARLISPATSRASRSGSGPYCSSAATSLVGT